MYKYKDLKPAVFTEEGQDMFLKIRDNVTCLTGLAGAVRLHEAISGVAGDTWLMLACVDRMVERGELREVTTGKVAAQDRVYVRTG